MSTAERNFASQLFTARDRKSSQPDQLRQQLEHHLPKAESLVQDFLAHPIVQDDFNEMRAQLPHIADHQYRVGIMATLMALQTGLPEEDVLIICGAALEHDIGKLNNQETFQSTAPWTEAQRIANRPAVRQHVWDSAERAARIDPRLYGPVLLHHSWQSNVPSYPTEEELVDRDARGELLYPLTRKDRELARIIALADNTDASLAREATDGRVVNTLLQMDKLRNEGEYYAKGRLSKRYFSDKEIRMSVTAFQMILHRETQSAA